MDSNSMDLKHRIIIKQGDITDMEVDAIVNAANTDLILGSGVAGSIRKRGGESIQQECDDIGPIAIGQAVVTRAGNLKSRLVIHAAGMHLGGRVSGESLRNVVKNSLQRADEKRVRTIAFPAIGTGVGGFPADECAEIMIDTVSKHLRNEKTSIERVYFVLFDEAIMDVFSGYLKSKD
jgi:O-acetyl-ADP-ribose deacetylase (regulator of RNase III)